MQTAWANLRHTGHMAVSSFPPVASFSKVANLYLKVLIVFPQWQQFFVWQSSNQSWYANSRLQMKPSTLRGEFVAWVALNTAWAGKWVFFTQYAFKTSDFVTNYRVVVKQSGANCVGCGLNMFNICQRVSFVFQRLASESMYKRISGWFTWAQSLTILSSSSALTVSMRIEPDFTSDLVNRGALQCSCKIRKMIQSTLEKCVCTRFEHFGACHIYEYIYQYIIYCFLKLVSMFHSRTKIWVITIQVIYDMIFNIKCTLYNFKPKLRRKLKKFLYLTLRQQKQDSNIIQFLFIQYTIRNNSTLILQGINNLHFIILQFMQIFCQKSILNNNYIFIDKLNILLYLNIDVNNIRKKIEICTVQDFKTEGDSAKQME
ncbi:Hypothetical_protein [Hexamita inflata]|uniref:Hypothetical_protein n=1 Tax=Hexamita inflata TaxID=28002 RepID=A0AA86PC85_9EUKA|nr:Hypothetical protein HINF_LOCUS21084 [Hexamita inflata]